MVVDLPRRWRWVMGAGCALVAVIALLFVVFSRPGEAAVVAVAAGAVPVFELPVVDAPPQSTAEPSAAESAEGHGPDEVQLCGGAWVRVGSNGNFDEEAFERASHEPKQRERILSEMRASGSEFARASTLVLEVLGGDEAHRAALLLSDAHCEARGCGATQEALVDVAQRRDTLARLAVATSDPKVYALAIRVCGDKHATDGACQLLSVEQWVRMDPDNAAPWKYMLERAVARGDVAAQEDALFHVANSRRNDTGYLAMTSSVLEATPPDEAGQLVAWMMMTEAANFEAMAELTAAQVSLPFCNEAALRDPNRAQICNGVAELLVERSATFLDRMTGVRIGERLGWPADRTDRIRGEYEAYSDPRLSRPSAASGGNEFSCPALERDIAKLRRHAALGELGVLREWIAKSGKRPEDFVAEGRLRRQQRAREAEQAAASAAARPRAAASAASN